MKSYPTPISLDSASLQHLLKLAQQRIAELRSSGMTDTEIESMLRARLAQRRRVH